jgi:hypothetical protein
MSKNDLFVGIDYSGAKTPISNLKGLQVYAARDGIDPEHIPPPDPARTNRRNWCRRDVAHWLEQEIRADNDRLIIGIDHGFSFPATYFKRYGLSSWDAFLTDFHRYWPTDEDGCYIDFIREGAWWINQSPPHGERIGDAKELRLCEQWTSSATSVFRMDGQGAVGKSTQAGLPWLKYIREHCSNQLHFWPFDGWQVPVGKSLIVEAYPSLYRRRYPKEDRTNDQHDAYAIARWLEETVRRESLDHYLNPPLTIPERKIAGLEGWILGVT